MHFKEFISKYPRYSKFNFHKSAEELFDFLCQPEIIDRMMIINDHAGLSALDAVVSDVETQFGSTPDFQLDSQLDARQMVGAMIKFILEPFGYFSVPDNRTSVKNSKIFRLAMHYVFDPTKRTLLLKKTIELRVCKL